MSRTVTVFCSLPNGLSIRLASGVVVLRGAGYPTPGVDAEEFENWLVANAGFAPLRKGAVWSIDEDQQPEPVQAAPTSIHPLDHDGDGRKGGSRGRKPKAEPEPDPAPVDEGEPEE